MYAFIEAAVDMESIIKKNFLIIQNKDKGTSNELIESNPVQMTLREEFEIVNQKLQDFEVKYRTLVNKTFSRDQGGESNNMFDL